MDDRPPSEVSSTGAVGRVAGLFAPVRFHGRRLEADDLRGLRLVGSRIVECHLEGLDVSGMDLREAVIRMCNLDGLVARRCDASAAHIEDSHAHGADLAGILLRASHLTETSFRRANLVGAILDGAEGDGVVLRGADLSGASLRGVRLLDPDFRGADLTDVDFGDADLIGADFRGAILAGVRWPSAVMPGAQFDGGVAPPAGFTPEVASAIEPTDRGRDELRDDSAALTAALSDLIDTATLAGTSGEGDLKAEMAEVARAWENLASQTGDDTAMLTELIAQVRGQLGPANAAAASGFDERWHVVVESLGSADDGPPPQVVTDLLELVIPTSLREHGADLDDLARRLESMFRAMGSSRDGGPDA